MDKNITRTSVKKIVRGKFFSYVESFHVLVSVTNRYIHIIDNNQNKIASDPRCASPRTPTKSVEVEDCVGRGEFATAYPALSRICVCHHRDVFNNDLLEAFARLHQSRSVRVNMFQYRILLHDLNCISHFLNV